MDFALLQCKDAPRSYPENARFRQMLQDVQRPAWYQEVDHADAAYASRGNLALMEALAMGML